MERVVTGSWKWLWQLLAVFVGVFIFTQPWQLWLMLFIALTLAAAMLPAARLGEQRRIPRAVTVLLIYGGILVLFAVAGLVLFPLLADQLTQFFGKLPALIENSKRWVGDFTRWAERFSIPIPAQKTPDLQGVVSTLGEKTLKASVGDAGAAVGVVLVFFLGAYFVIDGDRIGRGLLQFVSPERRGEFTRVAELVLIKVGGYVRGQLLGSLGVGIVIAVGLTLLGVPYSLAIGALATLLNIVPFIGSFIAAVLAILTALNISLLLAVWTALLFAGTNLLEGKVLMPYFLGRTTGLHPVAVLVGLLVGAKLAGLVGAIVAIPLLAGANVVIEALYLNPANQASRE
jgi:predicted PurR-regulated permease PerM